MPTGIIVIDKPQGLTSNGTLQRVRKAFGAQSAGHVGTLDPMATGMLPVCLDEATKVIAEIESGAKCYEFTVRLGSRTDTGDAEGRVVEEAAVGAPWRAHRADRAAVNAGGGDAGEEAAVEARVACAQREVAGVVVGGGSGVHGGIVGRLPQENSPFPDMIL